MPSARGFSLLLTASQAAARLGVPIVTVLAWAATGRLRIAGQDEDGRALFREGAIDTIGEQLRALTTPEIRFLSVLRTRCDMGRVPLLCGCNLARSPLNLCRTGAALNAALQLAEMLAVAVSDDPLLRKLAGVCHEALTKHLAPPVGTSITAEKRHHSGEAQENAAAKSTGSWPAVITSDTPAEVTPR